MSDILFVLLTALFIGIAAIMIVRKTDSKLTFFFIGTLALFTVTLITGNSVLGEDTTGNIYVDVIDVIRIKFVSQVKGTGIRLMIVASYVSLMTHIKASKVLAAAVAKVLVKLRKPYMILGGAFIAGCILKIFITSQVSLGLLFMATIFPILISLGVSKLSATVVLIAIGMMDWGPNDSSAIFGATDVLGVTPMEFFLNYEIYVCVAVIVVMAIFYAVYFKYMDKKEFGESAATQTIDASSFSPRDYGVPLFYGFFPLIPLILVIAGNITSVNFDIITANVIGFFIVFICELIVNKNVQILGDHLKNVFEWMGKFFTNVVVLMVAAAVFAEAIKQLKGIDIITGWISHMTGATLIAMVMLSVLILATAILTGSGQAPWMAFGPLTPNIASVLGINTAALAIPMHLTGGIARCCSPFCAGVIAISGVAEVEIGDVVKRNIVPMLVAYVTQLVATYIIFVIM
ncbi:MAG: C4-dicarboxylate transporter DcuC [Lachnospiraceae bacterium]|nr:C4-dicarboxylate transporter DcuC [Lachnospiraceae bacterium]